MSAAEEWSVLRLLILKPKRAQAQSWAIGFIGRAQVLRRGEDDTAYALLRLWGKLKSMLVLPATKLVNNLPVPFTALNDALKKIWADPPALCENRQTQDGISFNYFKVSPVNDP